MGSSVIMRIFLLVLAAVAVFAQDLDVVEEAPSPRYNCPLLDIDFYGDNIDRFLAIGMWQECGHICNIVPDCNFWTWNTADGFCQIKSSEGVLSPYTGAISGERGCVG